MPASGRPFSKFIKIAFPIYRPSPVCRSRRIFLTMLILQLSEFAIMFHETENVVVCWPPVAAGGAPW